jgi:hypothetical protein
LRKTEPTRIITSLRNRIIRGQEHCLSVSRRGVTREGRVR